MSYIFDSHAACIQDGNHLTSVDDDGYCNWCGHQEELPTTKEDYVKIAGFEVWQSKPSSLSLTSESVEIIIYKDADGETQVVLTDKSGEELRFQLG